MPYWCIVLLAVYLAGVILYILLYGLFVKFITSLIPPEEKERRLKEIGRFRPYKWSLLSFLGIILMFRIRIGK